MLRFALSTLFSFCSIAMIAQQFDVLPPTIPWKGKSIELIAKKNDAWITPAEQSDFATTPSYDETVRWLNKLCTASDILEMETAGQSDNGKKIHIVIASSDRIFDKKVLANSSKPLLLIQAGIHSGEIDGKDAGMMLLRDIAFGKKKELLKNVNIIFIPILNVDGHERTSPYNRVNQRGPSNMGWRTNARNLNLNRDFTKLDAAETRAVVGIMNDYNPTMYLDLHVTDGADYQYDITYGASCYSVAMERWMNERCKPTVDKSLKSFGHIPGPLMFAANDRDFTKGNSDFPYTPRFSDAYGNLRGILSILVENHSLKPFRQRVLGTYVFLEGIIRLLDSEGLALKQIIATDKAKRKSEITLTWAVSKPDSMTLLGVESKLLRSDITTSDYVHWTGKLVTQQIPVVRYKTPDAKAIRATAYWVPATYHDVIERLRLHGIKMEEVREPKTVDVELYRISDPKFSNAPFEGHFTVTGKSIPEKHKETFYPGSVRVSTDQELGDLVIFLLEPASADSFFQWGFFPEIFSQTEYIEEYAVEPLARVMLSANENLRTEFEQKKLSDPAFANDKIAIYRWFYTRSPFIDARYLLYPVGVER